jgi:hypothetical protein
MQSDDYFLPDRFSVAKKVFKDDPTCEGVYEAIGMHIEDDKSYRRWIESGKSEETLKTIREYINPGRLGEALIKGVSGHFHLDGFIVKKDVLEKSGYMNEKLMLHQDTDFIIRISIVARLLPGRLDEPVAKWRVHDNNRISAPRSKAQEYKNRMSFWMSLYHWSKEHSNTDIQEKILNGIVRYTRSHKYFKNFPLKYFPVHLVWIIRLLRLLGYPEVIFGLLMGQKVQ